VGAPVEGAAPHFGERHTVAALRPLRALPQLPPPAISLDYISSNGAQVNGHPAFPRLDPGHVYLFPLKAEGSRYRLLVEEGWGLVAPAIEAAPGVEAIGSKRDFILVELRNVLVAGSYPDLYNFGQYIQFLQGSELIDDLMPGLTVAWPPGDRHWLDLATAMLAQLGVPRRSLDDLIAGNSRKRPFESAPELLAAAALREVPEAERRERIVRNMLRWSAVHGWGSAATLAPEFKDDPLLLQLLPGYLREPQKGAFLIAQWLVSDGQTALEALTLDTAVRVLTDARLDNNERFPACRLILERGTETQFVAYLRALRDARLHNEARYRELYQVAWEAKSPRVVPILAVLLDDPRTVPHMKGLRYCDLAAPLAQKVSAQDFGVAGGLDRMTLAQRDAAVAKARAWVRSQSGR